MDQQQNQDNASFGWGCYWKLKTKDDEIRALRNIIKHCVDPNALRELVSLDEELKVQWLKKEERKLARMLKQMGIKNK
jgi:hypothetical protein